MNSEAFDFVVVGAGTAGCVLTHRLSAAGCSVCLLEAGPSDWNPLIHLPAGYIKNLYSKTLTWNFSSEPGPGVNGRSFSLPQGRVLGGSSSINGLNYVRGQATDYDNWAQLGNPGWSYEDVLPYFRRSENKQGSPDPKYRGTVGELTITDLDWHHPVSDALIDAAVSLGIPRNPDHNAEHQEGAGYFQRTMAKGLRISSAKAFLSKAKKLSNVSIRTHCQSTRILFDGKRAKGVEYVVGGRGGDQRRVSATREVIISAGAVKHSKTLAAFRNRTWRCFGGARNRHVSLAARHRNNLRDHYAVRMVSRVAGIKTINELVQGPALLLQLGKWLMGYPSPLAISPSVVHIFCKSNPAFDRPDLEFACAPASFREGVVGLLDKQPGLTLGVWQERPESHGFTHIRSADPFESPRIQPNYLTHETDRLALLGGMRIARRLFRSAPLQKYVVAETSPTPDIESDEALLEFARQKGTTVYHMTGTARMGPADRKDSVVDHQLRVHGLEALRVADASIMPSMPSANTNASTLMIAEKASDMILGKAAG